LRQGTLSNEEIFADHGHGAIVHPDYPHQLESVRSRFRFVAVTGPNRRMAESLDYYMATPHGDMMLSGAFGLVAAARRVGLAN
jgi:uncharacterized protein (DUF1786 family)